MNKNVQILRLSQHALVIKVTFNIDLIVVLKGYLFIIASARFDIVLVKLCRQSKDADSKFA